ncbi:MAG: bromoperoxidase, partial [Pseudomonadota bacterium]
GRPRTTGPGGNLNAQTVFRGASPGVDRGPYLSQLMLIGNPGPGGVTPADGFVAFGAQRVDQRVLEALPGKDYVMAWDDWRAIQQGYAIQGVGQEFTGNTRFIHTVRDLATYVHIDALYQAYLNACLILLGNGTPFDPSFALLSGRGRLLIDAVSGARMPYNAGGFALWGGPHILSLVTEVATRGLKAVRYQKFNNHIRLRPEALAARMERAAEIEEAFPSACGCFSDMANALDSVISQVRLNNQARANESTALLPMAFEEGSPMHPAYGAGHATVAGACVTMLKAFFDTSAVFVRVDGNAGFHDHAQIVQALKDGAAVEVGAYQSVDDGKCLDFTGCGEYVLEGKGDKAVARFKADRARGHCCPLTLEGELNKLAANVSIGRNMAGVHYFSDYFDSVRMGEEIAIGILEEQALGYTTDPFVLSVPTFDGQTRRVGAR